MMPSFSPARRARALCAVALTVAGACSKTAPPPSRVATNVLIITIDTLRADHVGVYGATAVKTPSIDRIAREGGWAPQADVPVPLTRPSHVSLFTGRYPYEHAIRDNLSPPLDDHVPVLAEQFRQAGFATAAFIASAVLDRQSGLARGFDVYSDRFPDGLDQRTADVVTTEAIGWLRSPPKQRFFAWVHLYDPHAPYAPPEPYASQYGGRPYDGEVAFCDDQVGRIIDALRDAGRLETTIVIVTSDHGEALGDHGEDVHGFFIYEATLHVPLVFRGPGVTPGTRLGTIVRTVDLFPTVLDLAGLGAASTNTSGRSLAPALRGERQSDEPVFAESLVPLLHYGWSDLRSIRDGRWKYVLAPRPELYDLDNDPGELHDLHHEQPTRGRALRSALEEQLRKEKSLPTASNRTSGISADVLERLGSLGYVSPGGSTDRKSAGADPKDKLEEYKTLSTRMQQALVALRAGDAPTAVANLQDVRKRGLDSYELHYYLGRAYARQQRWREALTEYETATARFAGGAEAWRGLGEARVALRDAPGAVRAFETLVSLAPQDPMALMQLGEAYRDLARWDDASAAMRHALALDAGPAQYWNSLGTVLGGGQKMSEAERAFGEAVKREPTNGLYRYNHALALQQLGRRADAVAEFRQAAAAGYRGQ